MIQMDLNSCDQEPIHIPGAVLPHGALLAVDPATFEILQAAGDTATMIGFPPGALAGRGLERCLAAAQLDHLRHLTETEALARPRHLLDPMLRATGCCPADASVHRIDGVLVIEWEAADPADPHRAGPLATVQSMLDQVSAASSATAFCQAAADAVRRVAGYDRVMVYQFQDDDSGWVIAESRKPESASFLDLHYPASDIPKQARALYAKTWLRLITQVNYDPAPLFPPLNPRTGRPLDMSFAILRDVSPVHRQYLRNMGIGASMSISVMQGERLWGLIACHHASPRYLPRHLRAICELFGSMFSLQLEARERAEQLSARLAGRDVLQNMMRALASEGDYGQALVSQGALLNQYMHADGLSVRLTGTPVDQAETHPSVFAFGSTPPEPFVNALCEWLSTRTNDDGIFATDRLGDLWPPARDHAALASGILAISVSREPKDFIVWFRPEVVTTVKWAGNPVKPVEAGPFGERLTPRSSFALWQETVRGRCLPWTQGDIAAALDLRVTLMDVILRRIDAAVREQARAREHERLLMAELDHRVKNTLAVIQALVGQTGRRADTLADYVTGLERRIGSMARSQNLLTQSRWEGIAVRTLLAGECEQYDHAGRIVALRGPDITLAPKAGLALSLAVHELATNAAKYGALSVDGGQVRVDWALDGNGALVLSWVETGGPAVDPSPRRGFGSTLIERALSMETGGRAELLFRRDGVQCKVELPATTIVGLPAAAVPSGAGAVPNEAPEAASRPPRVLIVEDMAMVVMMIEAVIDELGWTVVGPAARVDAALRLAREETIDLAVLDINLDGAMSWDVATALRARGIPFVFTTGYSDRAIMPAHLAGSPVLGKPFRVDQLEAQLKEMLLR